MGDIYKGYRELIGTTQEINDYMENIYDMGFYPNEYLIIQNTDDGSENEMRWDGEKLVTLKLPPSKYIKGKNALQRCALDMLNNPNITVCALLGNPGSGKTFLAMSVALRQVQERGNQSRILGIREIRGDGLSPGALPGDIEDKTGAFFMPLVQQLDGGEFELESLKQRGIVDTIIPYFIKGCTFNHTLMICDESEDMTERQIKLIGTRVGQNSRIIFCGDYKQSVLKNTTDNAYLKMCRELRGNPMFGAVYLEDDVRSETSKLFANLFQ